MKTQAAILVASREPLVIDEVEVPALGFGQVLVEIKVTRICGSQIGEIGPGEGQLFCANSPAHQAYRV